MLPPAVFLYGDTTAGGDLSPLTLARWPNQDHVPKEWASGSVDGYTIYVDSVTAQRVAAWSQQLQYDPHSILAHYLGGYGKGYKPALTPTAYNLAIQTPVYRLERSRQLRRFRGRLELPRHQSPYP